MVNKHVRGGTGKEAAMPTPAPAPTPAAASQPAPVVASVPAGSPPRPGRSPAVPAAPEKKCEKCDGAGKYVHKDKRGFESRVACECKGGGILK